MTNKVNVSDNYQITPWEQLDISNHYMFRLVMENPELCQVALERILGIKITKLVVLIAEKSIEYKYSSKGIRLDIYAEDDKGVAYDLEMQALDAQKSALGKRTRYYQSMLDGDALKKGTLYSNLRKSYVIFICKFDPFDKNLGRYTFNSWCDEDKSLNLGDSATKILLNTKGNKTGMSDELKIFLEFIDTNSPQDEYTRCLADTVENIHKDEGARNLYMTFEQQLMEKEARVREEMQQYIANAEQKAANAEQKAANAEQKAANAEQKAANAEQKAANAEQKAANAEQLNIDNIISMCKNFKFSNEQIIEELMKRASLSQEEAANYLSKY